MLATFDVKLGLESCFLVFFLFGVVLARPFFPIFRQWIPKLCKGVYFVDLGERFQTNNWLEKIGFDTAENKPKWNPSVKFARSPFPTCFFTESLALRSALRWKNCGSEHLRLAAANWTEITAYHNKQKIKAVFFWCSRLLRQKTFFEAQARCLSPKFCFENACLARILHFQCVFTLRQHASLFSMLIKFDERVFGRKCKLTKIVFSKECLLRIS